MVHVSGDLRIVTEDPSTVRHVIVRSPRARPHGDGMITGEPARFPVDNGRVEFEAAPGPVIVVLERMQDSGERFEGVVPDKEATTLRRVLEATVRYDPPVIHDAQAARDRAEAAAEQTAADRTQTGKDAAEAERQADIAVGSAQAASEDREQTGKDRQAAAKSADGAAASAKAAAADAAKTAADRTHIDGARAHIDSQVTHVNQVRGEVDSIATDFVEEATGISETISTEVAKSVEAAGRIGTAKQVEDWSKAAEQAAKKAETSSEGVQTVVDNAAAVVQQRVSDDADRAETAATRAEGAMDGKADLIGGVVPTSQIPAVALTKPFPVATIEDMLDLDVQEGDIAIVQQGEGKGSYILGDGPVSELSSWHALEVATDTVTSINGQTGTVVLQAHDVGAAPVEHEHRWSEIRDKPSSYTPASHSHPWSEVTGKPSAFPPDNHRHPADQIDGLEALIRDRVMAILREVPFLVMWDGEGEWVPGEWASIRQGVLNLDSSEIHSVVEKGEA